MINGVSLGYDAENRQITNGVNGASQEVYDYDGEGRRVRHQHQSWNGTAFVTVSNGTTYYVYDAFGNLAAEYGAQSANSPCVTCYLTTDSLGSTRMMTDENGVVQIRYDYLFKVVIEEDKFEDGRRGYTARCPAIEAAVTWGETEGQALQRIDELVTMLVQMSVERGEPIPAGGVAIELESPAVVVNL